MSTTKLYDIYEKKITRNINPAVAANKMDNDTIHTEIGEYVFSDDIINALHRVLTTIKGDGLTDKKGIWINGYYGSGKSHFLKYVHYCMNPATSTEAFNHLYAELDKIDPFDSSHNLECSKTDFMTLQRWFGGADVDDILFNVQTFSDTAHKGRGTFTNVFFNMFNKSRGLNGSNIKLAVLLENKLKESGHFDEFIAKIEEEGFNWTSDYTLLAHSELDTVLQAAKACDSTIDVDSLKNALLDKDAFQITIDIFAKELKKYLDKRGDKARIVFLVDEVSQFINNNKDVLLDLQDLVEHTSNTCKNQVIIACTAQQTMDEMADGTGVSSLKKLDEIGKIMGRFETRVSLQSSDPSYITKKRILAKKGIYEGQLGKLYEEEKNAIQAQFVTDNQQYKGYQDMDDFVSSYPFVPYQFELISKVFEGFQSKDYVQKEVKDNERSILKITHVTAKRKKDESIGYFVPFDAFYNDMMEQNFIHKGHRAIEPALKLDWGDQEQKAFALRVIHVLFMISNLNEANHQQLESTIQNMTWLMIDSLDNNKKELKEKITKVIDTLRSENVIREEKGNYYFYNEDEAELSSIIKNTTSRNLESELDTFNKEILSEVITKLGAKFSTDLRSFSVQISIDGKSIVNVANPDLKVLFTLFESSDVAQLALKNERNCMIVCIHELLNQKTKIRNEFIHYCRVNDYIRVNQNTSNKIRANSIANFRERFRNLMVQELKPAFAEMINHAPILIGPERIDSLYISGKKGKDRYESALKELIRLNYSKLQLVKGYPLTADELNRFLNKSKTTNLTDLSLLSDAGKMVEQMIKLRGNQINLVNLIGLLDKAPYGWPTMSILGVLIDLNKHKLRSFTYKNEKRYPLDEFINKAQIKKELPSLEIVSMQRISQDVIRQLREDWLEIFNKPLSSQKDGDDLFNDVSGLLLDEQIASYQQGCDKARKYVFVKAFDRLIAELSALKNISDPEIMYQTIHDQVDELTQSINLCNSLIDMMSRSRFMDEYNAIIHFVTTRKDDIKNLQGDYSAQWQLLETFLDEENPSASLKTASKVRKELQGALNQEITEKKGELISKYTDMYKEIDLLADKNDILKEDYKPLYTFVDGINNCEKIDQLLLFGYRLDDEKGELRKKILDLAVAKKQRKTEAPVVVDSPTAPSGSDINPDSKPAKPTPEKRKVTKHYKLQKPDKFFENVEEVDNYINKIREDIKHLIDDDNIVIID